MLSKLERIVIELNNSIQSKMQPLFTEGTMLFNGIVKPVYKQNEIINSLQPENEKNFKDVVFTDKHALQVYHKVINPIALNRDVNSNDFVMRGQARLQCIVYSSHLSRLHLLESIVSAFPTIMKVKGLQSITVATNNVNTNEPQIFANERGQIPYNLNPHWQLASIEYTINYTYNEKC